MRATRTSSQLQVRHSTTGKVQSLDGHEAWQRYLAGASAGVESLVVVGRGEGNISESDRVKILWGDGHESEFSGKWLRDHCPTAFNRDTKQREVN